MSKVIIMDTSILCCWLNVAGKGTCGPTSDQWNQQRVREFIEKEQEEAIFVLPLATIIETGNHIAQARERRFETANELAEILTKTAESQSPWAAFTDQTILWNADSLKSLAQEWPPLASQKLAMGDATIKRVADYYASSGNEVEILTGDQQLRSYTPAKPRLIPRRRK